MKLSKALAAETAAAERPDVPLAGDQFELGLPETLGAEDLENVFTKLAAAVPPAVGHDPVQQRKERLIIQVIYRVVATVKHHVPENPWDRETPYDKELERIINARLQAAGSKGKARLQKNSPLETRIARCIFPDRRRAHVASAVIRAAISKGIGPNELLQFIQDSNGTEAIRRKTSGTTKNAALRLMWATKPLATITLPHELVGEQTSETPKTMLFTVRRTGEVDIRWVGDNAATARSALSAFAKSQAKSVVTHDAA